MNPAAFKHLDFDTFLRVMFPPSQNFTKSGLQKRMQRHKMANMKPAPDPVPMTRQVRRQNERLAKKPPRFT